MFVFPVGFDITKVILTHLERNSEHQHSEDESPECPVPKHLRVGEKKEAVSGYIGSHNPPHGLVNILQVVFFLTASTEQKRADRHLHVKSAAAKDNLLRKKHSLRLSSKACKVQ